MYYGMRALIGYRTIRWARESLRRPTRWPIIALVGVPAAILVWFVRLAYDIRLESSAEIGPGLTIWHFGGIRVRRCRVGSNCGIHQEVVIEPARPDGPGPILGDRVWVGPHARIVGEVRIGDGATVSAGAVVIGDVPPRALVAGNPARIVRIEYENRSLFQ
jgi:serine O-acetyltransferase